MTQIVCPNCNEVLNDDEQLVIHSVKNGVFQVDHVQIYSQPDIKIAKLCSSLSYTRLTIDS